MKNYTELLLATPSMCQSRDLLIHVLCISECENERFSRFSYFDMLMVLGEYRKHYTNIEDLYAAGYSDRQQKSHMDFKRLADRFCRFSTVKQIRVKRRPIVNENNAATILAFAALNPHARSR